MIQLLEQGEGDEPDSVLIRLHRQETRPVYTPDRGELQRLEDAFVLDEIGTGDPEPVSGH
ncbi:hypothetical protein [Thiocapsa sp. UBA6158]|jgi:hypothetical protein|uniref:hypothetical protein n=1 Tax=Thiocapsa sp. UBA6158 TaxID=1947692 RepID=UPI0025F61AAE|nr:hypothetical protein [Thiocapsa sp. UBA6158]